jgi:hypothetical protein
VRMGIKEELHHLVDRLGDEPAREALVYLQRLVDEETEADAGAASGLARRMGSRTTPGRIFLSAPRVDLATIMARQGVKPVVSFDVLLGDFWPDDETADEFIATVRQWRSEGGRS